MAFTHTKKVDIESFIMARIRIRIRSQTSGSGSDQKGPDPTGSGSATLINIKTTLYCNKKNYLWLAAEAVVAGTTQPFDSSQQLTAYLKLHIEMNLQILFLPSNLHWRFFFYHWLVRRLWYMKN
jgi:hypothetical protein